MKKKQVKSKKLCKFLPNQKPGGVAGMERQRNSGQVKRFVGHHEFLSNSAIFLAKVLVVLLLMILHGQHFLEDIFLQSLLIFYSLDHDG